MDVSVVLTSVQTILQLLDSPIKREIESLWSNRSQLDKLKTTMTTIRAVLLDAEQQERQQVQLSNTQQNKLERLKEAVYQADDLFDEVATLAMHKNLMSGNNVTKEVRLFFSRFNQLRSARTLRREIEKVLEILDGIARDHHNFGSTQSVVFPVNNSRKTHSYVSEKEDVIIGRDDDKRIVIDMLVDTTVEENVSVVSIVGIGGLGKTTLAQLIFNDERIQGEFPLKMWVCVSDDFNVEALIRQILAAATNEAVKDGLIMDQLQKNLRENLNGKKYLLVLDDVWNEDSERWRKLRTLLVVGGRGSRVVVTTRSRNVAKVVGSHQTHELKGLSEEKSWELFERMTLEPGQHQLKEHLVDIGKEIVRNCAYVPLAIRVVGSLLQGQGESRWRYFKNTGLANIKLDEINSIMAVLKISYYYLPFHLKSCFSFCAIFPKDTRISKETLISLWMALGFILPEGESFEDAGEKYFMDLLQRCFFQDVERAVWGEIISCKMHDLIHDVAKEVAGSEISIAGCFDEKARHLNFDNYDIAKNSAHNLTHMKRLRTIFQRFASPDDLKLLQKFRYLRVLKLRNMSLKKLPSRVGELVHLRYLHLSDNSYLSELPESITQLYNLQTLNLRDCVKLNELPRELSKLVNLRHLDIQGCYGLTHMPQGMRCMTSLHKLTRFVLCGRRSSSWSWGSSDVGGLRDLKELNNLNGSMEIMVRSGWTYDVAEEHKYLINKPLREIEIRWYDSGEGFIMENGEALLESMQPHSNLTKLVLKYYPGEKFPRWGCLSIMNLQNCLPNLVEIQLFSSERLENLPLMSQLRHLKVLSLQFLDKVEYMESSNNSGEGASAASTRSRQVEGADDELVFFPSLEKLFLWEMPKLKGWWKTSTHSESESESEVGEGSITREVGFQSYSYSYSFPKLSQLTIMFSSNLATFPLCPKLEELDLEYFSEALSPIMKASSDGRGLSSSSNEDVVHPHDESPSTSASDNNRQKEQQQEGRGRLRKVKITNVGYLNSLPMESFQHLSYLRIYSDEKMERLTTGDVGEVFRSGRLSSLHSLEIDGCSKLKSLSGQGVWEHFTALETLHLKNLSELALEDEEDVRDDIFNTSSSKCTKQGEEKGEIKEDFQFTDADMPWRYLAPTLRHLVMVSLPKLVKLPKGMQQLTALRSLTILECDNLEALPPWIANLSLQSLEIGYCKKLKSPPKEVHHLTSVHFIPTRI